MTRWVPHDYLSRATIRRVSFRYDYRSEDQNRGCRWSGGVLPTGGQASTIPPCPALIRSSGSARPAPHRLGSRKNADRRSGKRRTYRNRILRHSVAISGALQCWYIARCKTSGEAIKMRNRAYSGESRPDRRRGMAWKTPLPIWQGG